MKAALCRLLSVQHQSKCCDKGNFACSVMLLTWATVQKYSQECEQLWALFTVTRSLQYMCVIMQLEEARVSQCKYLASMSSVWVL